MKHLPLILAAVLVAVAVLVNPWRSEAQTNIPPTTAADMAAQVKVRTDEIALQQAEIQKTQQLITTELAAASTDVEQARIFAARSGGGGGVGPR